MSNSTELHSEQKTIDIVQQVGRLALPVMLTNLLQSIVSVVDVFMVGRLGPIPIAAVGMGTAIRMLVLIMMLSVAAGAMSLISQAKGARDPERMSFVTRQAISSGVLLSLVLTVFGLLLAYPLLSLANSGGDPQAAVLGTQYLQILFIGTPFLVLNIVLNRLMQGAGDTVTPLILTGSINILNVIFNYILMFGLGPIPAFGLNGAAMGTVLARGLGVLAALTIIYSNKNVIRILPGSYKPDWQMYNDIFSIGVPSGVQGLFRNGSRLLVITIVTSTEAGTYGAAALAIGFQVESLAFMPVLGINVAATSLVGQALGSWQPQAARQRGNVAIFLGVVMMTLFIIPIVTFAPAIIRFFDPSAHPVLLETGISYLRINTVALPLSGIAMVANGALRGAGDTLPGMISTMSTRAFISIILAYIFGLVLGFGSVGVWWALVIGVALNALYMGLRWHGKAWLAVALSKTELYRKHLKYLPLNIQQRYLQDVRTPLMAQPEAREWVNGAGVVYSFPKHEVAVKFEANDYHVEEAKKQPVGLPGI